MNLSDTVEAKSEEHNPPPTQDWVISLDDLNCGNCFDILKKKGFKDEVEKLTDNGLTPSTVLDTTTEELEQCGISRPAINVLKDISEGLYTCKIVNDPIHGHFEIHPLCLKIIDTQQFQRLRYLKQLGAKYYVYPGASHNRFEHSLGVCYLAGEFVSMLRKRQPELNISDNDILCVQIAGLCHDLGHGPFSHMFDDKFLPAARPGNKIKHEQLSVEMFDFLVESNKLSSTFEKYGLTKEDRDFIKEQIADPLQKTGRYHGTRAAKKGFLYEIVSNKRNGIDVDKWDYFARDCHMLGFKNNFDHIRCMKCARVLSVDGELQICFRDKEVGNLYDMFHTRNTLQRLACQHRVGNIIEAMITEAMLEADKVTKIIPGKNGSPRENWKICQSVDDMEVYQKVTDDIFQQILWSNDETLEKSRKILIKIQNRELYKCVGQTRRSISEKLEDVKIKEDLFKILRDNNSDLTREDIVTHSVTMDYGMRDQNPIEHVRFYGKKDPKNPFKIPRNEVSNFIPKNFAEQFIEIYCKKKDGKSIIQATEAFKKWMEECTVSGDNSEGLEHTVSTASTSTANSPLQNVPNHEITSHLSYN